MTKGEIRAAAGTKIAKQAAFQNSINAPKERNKYVPKVDPSRAAKLAAWNAEIDRQIAARAGRLWKWQMNAAQNGMELVDRAGKSHALSWAIYESIPPVRYVACTSVAYPINIAKAENLVQTAAEIVDRIVAYLNKEC